MSQRTQYVCDHCGEPIDVDEDHGLSVQDMTNGAIAHLHLRCFTPYAQEAPKE